MVLDASRFAVSAERKLSAGFLVGRSFSSDKKIARSLPAVADASYAPPLSQHVIGFLPRRHAPSILRRVPRTPNHRQRRILRKSGIRRWQPAQIKHRPAVRLNTPRMLAVRAQSRVFPLYVPMPVLGHTIKIPLCIGIFPSRERPHTNFSA